MYLLLVVPLLTALGVSFAYYTGDRLFELEATWPITPEQVIWGRTLLVVGYDIVLATGASAVLAAVSGGLSWIVLVTTWLAPLFGLAAVALLASTHLGPWQGTAVSTGLWASALSPTCAAGRLVRHRQPHWRCGCGVDGCRVSACSVA